MSKTEFLSPGVDSEDPHRKVNESAVPYIFQGLDRRRDKQLSFPDRACSDSYDKSSNVLRESSVTFRACVRDRGREGEGENIDMFPEKNEVMAR